MEETVAEKLKKLESLLEEYENGLHIKQFDIIEVNFEEDMKTMKKSSLEDIHHMCLRWGMYATGIQKQVNKHKTRLTWAEKNLYMLCAKEAEEYKGYAYQERKDQVMVKNSYAKALYELAQNSQIFLDRLSFYVNRIDYLTKTAQDFIETKRKAQYYNRGS